MLIDTDYLRVAEQEVARVGQIVRDSLVWTDNLGANPQTKAVGTKYGGVTYMGVAFAPEAPEGEIVARVAKKHDYRLMGVARAGSTLSTLNEFGLFMYLLAHHLGAPRKTGTLIELTNTAITRYTPGDMDAPGFRSAPPGDILTLSWPYQDESDPG